MKPPSSLGPTVSRELLRHDDDGVPAHLELDLLGQARLLDQGLRKPNSPGITNADESGLHDGSTKYLRWRAPSRAPVDARSHGRSHEGGRSGATSRAKGSS